MTATKAAASLGCRGKTHAYRADRAASTPPCTTFDKNTGAYGIAWRETKLYICICTDREQKPTEKPQSAPPQMPPILDETYVPDENSSSALMYGAANGSICDSIAAITPKNTIYAATARQEMDASDTALHIARAMLSFCAEALSAAGTGGCALFRLAKTTPVAHDRKNCAVIRKTPKHTSPHNAPSAPIRKARLVFDETAVSDDACSFVIKFFSYRRQVHNAPVGKPLRNPQSTAPAAHGGRPNSLLIRAAG